MGRNKRESVMPVRVDRLLSDESMGDMTGVFMQLFEEDVQGVDRYGVTLLSRRMASSYANRPGSLLPKSPRGVGEILDSALLPSTTLPVELDVQGVEMMGRGYARGPVITFTSTEVAREALELHMALWMATGRRGTRPSLQETAHVRLGVCDHELGKAALSGFESLLPGTMVLRPAEMQLDAKYQPHEYQ